VAAYDSRPGYDALSAELKAGTLHRAYLLWGSEDFLLRRAVEGLVNLALGAGDDAFNLARFDAERDNFADALGVAHQLPMLKPRRVVVVERILTRDASGYPKLNLRSGERDRLKAYVASPSEFTVLILTAGVSDYRQRSLTGLAPALKIFHFDAPAAGRLIRWIAGKAGTLGLKLTPDASELLLDAVGPSMTRLSSEIEKLALYCDEGGTADVGAVTAIVVGGGEESIFELSEAIGRRDPRSALRILRSIVATPDGLTRAVGEIRRYFTQLLQIRASLDAGENPARIAAALRLPGFVVTKRLPAARAWNVTRLAEVLCRLTRIESSAKGGEGDAEAELELLVWGAVGGIPGDAPRIGSRPGAPR
jgi:DNA polymerase-3 subunit delta